MTNYDYQKTEEFLIQLLGELQKIFSASERNEVQEFIDVGEYGLALETLVDIVTEENKRIPEKTLLLVCKLADMMQLDKSRFKEKLCKYVIGN